MNSISNPVPHVLRVADLRAHSNDALLEATQNLAQNERRITLEILHHLREIERRRAFAKLGHASLWEYAMKELNYSESSAYRRISAMRALNEHPELEEKIQEGKITVTTVSQVQTFLKAEQFQANKVYSADAKRELFAKCAGKSGKDVTRELITLSPLGFRVQKERVLSEDRTQISFVADPALLSKLHRVRDLSASRLKDAGSYPELMELMSEVTLDKIDPLRRAEKRKSRCADSIPDQNVVHTLLRLSEPLQQLTVPHGILRQVFYIQDISWAFG
ncbi:MAG: hypothetical protein H7222_10285 [Methylotenera sp.]|nr:hypothetical protein [Oligoflexia bacterium]